MKLPQGELVATSQIANADFPSLDFTLDTDNRASAPVDKLNLGYVKGYFSDTAKILTSPIHWDKKDWLKAGLVAGTTSGLFLVDANIRDFAQNHQNSVGKRIASVGNFWGSSPIYAVTPLAGFYLYGYLGDDHKARRSSLLALESLAISGAFTEGFKRVVGRHRPNTGDAPGTMDGPVGASNFSFASGHTSSAFSIATIFANEYKENPYVAPVAYGLASMVGLSRIYSDAHWSSDVFFGAAIGYFTSKALLSFHKEKVSPLSITPLFGHGVAGVNVGYKF